MTDLGGTWNEIELQGHTCHVYEPPNPSPHGYTVLYLHGVHSGNLRDHDAFVEQFDQYGLRVMAPVTGRSWWTDRISSDFDSSITAERFVKDVVMEEIQRVWDVRPPRIGLLGTSMGGQGALRLAFKFPDTFPIVAALSPAIDYQTRWEEGDEVLRELYPDAEAARQDTAILHIHPLYWPRNIWFCCDPTDVRWHTSAERLRMKLAALGIPHEAELETEAGGHGFPYYNEMASRSVGFIADRLERERLRIV